MTQIKHALVLALASTASLFLFGCNDTDNEESVKRCEAALHDFYVKKTRALDNAMSKVQQKRTELTPTSIDMVQAFLDGRICWTTNHDLEKENPYESNKDCKKMDPAEMTNAHKDPNTPEANAGNENTDHNGKEAALDESQSKADSNQNTAHNGKAFQVAIEDSQAAYRKCVEASGYVESKDTGPGSKERHAEIKNPKAGLWQPKKKSQSDSGLEVGVRKHELGGKSVSRHSHARMVPDSIQQ